MTCAAMTGFASRSSQRFRDQPSLLRGMRAGRTGGGARRGLAADVTRTFAAPERLLQSPIDEGPGAGVLRLLLAPHQFGVAIRGQFARQCLLRERIDLLQAQDR